MSRKARQNLSDRISVDGSPANQNPPPRQSGLDLERILVSIVEDSYDLTMTSIDARLGLLSDKDFQEFALSQGKTPNELLNLPDVLPRSQACSSPIVLDRYSEDGTKVEVVFPCGTQNALKCASCAEFSQRLRQRQILNGFDTSNSETRVALFTNTAPSFGRVHRSSLTAKTAYKFRNLHPAKREKVLAAEMRKKGACECKKFHRFDDPVIGIPLNWETYGYARETIWSENLPNLVKSMTRKLRYLARQFGIHDENMGLFTVFERQKRGSLHTHTLVVVRGNPDAFDRLAKEVKTGWGSAHIPTARIDPLRVEWYESDLVANRWKTYGVGHLPSEFDSKKSIPQANWKGGELLPATQFGNIFDWRELSGSRNLDGETDGQNGFKQAGAYLSKYLTKNQQATATAAIYALPVNQGAHFLRLRLAAAVLTLDRVMHETVIRTLERNLNELEQELSDLTNPEPGEVLSEEDFTYMELLELKAGVAYQELQESVTNLKKIAAHPLYELLFRPNEIFYNVGRRDIEKVSKSYGQTKASRGLSIRINKALDNAGFSGTLVGISHWGTTLKDLKDEMREFMAQANPGTVTEEEFEYVMNPVRMKEIRGLRAPRNQQRSSEIIKELKEPDRPETEDLALLAFMRCKNQEEKSTLVIF